MPDTGRRHVTLAAAGICAAGMAVLAAGVALALGTAGHDWYAAWKLTLVEAMLGAGFSDYGVVEYRTAAGETVTVERYRLAYVMNEAWLARRRILSLAADRALLGACAGLALFGTWRAVRMALRLRRLESGRGGAVEPAPRVPSGYAGRMHRPDDWSDGELIAALVRRSGGVGVLLVPAAEAGRLAGGGNDAAGHPETPRDSLPPARAPGLPPPESVKPDDEAAVPTKPVLADPGSRADATQADKPAGGRTAAHGREPGEEFF